MGRSGCLVVIWTRSAPCGDCATTPTWKRPRPKRRSNWHGLASEGRGWYRVRRVGQTGTAPLANRTRREPTHRETVECAPVHPHETKVRRRRVCVRGSLVRDGSSPPARPRRSKSTTRSSSQAPPLAFEREKTNGRPTHLGEVRRENKATGGVRMERLPSTSASNGFVSNPRRTEMHVVRVSEWSQRPPLPYPSSPTTLRPTPIGGASRRFHGAQRRVHPSIVSCGLHDVLVDGESRIVSNVVVVRTRIRHLRPDSFHRIAFVVEQIQNLTHKFLCGHRSIRSGRNGTAP